MTFPNGIPRCTISASVTSLGMLRMWMTRDGAPLLLSNFACKQKKKTHEREAKGTQHGTAGHVPTCLIESGAQIHTHLSSFP